MLRPLLYVCVLTAFPLNQIKKPMRIISPHRQYAFSQSAATINRKNQ